MGNVEFENLLSSRMLGIWIWCSQGKFVQKILAVKSSRWLELQDGGTLSGKRWGVGERKLWAAPSLPTAMGHDGKVPTGGKARAASSPPTTTGHDGKAPTGRKARAAPHLQQHGHDGKVPTGRKVQAAPWKESKGPFLRLSACCWHRN